MVESSRPSDAAPVRVALIATPDAQISPLSGIFESLNAFPLLADLEPDLPRHPFDVVIIAPERGSVHSSSGLSIGAHHTHVEVDQVDLVIVPLMTVDGKEWVPGRYPNLVEWLRRQHRSGALLASACTGVLLLAETGLLDGHDATIHWAFAPTLRRHFPDVRLRSREVLVVSGGHQEFVMTGGVMSWHDLVLYLIARYVGPSGAQAMARMLMLEWHGDGQAPYIEFLPGTEHGDAQVAVAQRWLRVHFARRDAVPGVIARAGVPRRTFERRFREATGHSPLSYVQNLRIAEARRLLERTDRSVESVALEAGYENTAFFRRIFKRITRMTPGAYRRKFRICL